MSHWPHKGKTRITTFGKLTRSQLMSRVRSTGNKTTELRLLKQFRESRITGWRRHYSLPGKPDFTFPIYKLAVFVDGCFWHDHNCHRNLTPRTNGSSWQEKIDRNRRRDSRVNRILRRQGWKVVRLWECKLRTQPEKAIHVVRQALVDSRG